jgi:hypothetical protein
VVFNGGTGTNVLFSPDGLNSFVTPPRIVGF